MDRVLLKVATMMKPASASLQLLHIMAALLQQGNLGACFPKMRVLADRNLVQHKSALFRKYAQGEAYDAHCLVDAPPIPKMSDEMLHADFLSSDP